MPKSRMIFLLFVLAFGLVFGQTPPTQTPSQPGQTPPSQQTPPAPSTAPAPAGDLKAAEELVQTMDVKSTFDQGKEAMIKAQIQSNPQLGQFEDLIRQFTDKYLTWDQVKGQYVNIYADMFTETELRELIQLYQTPTGKKLLSSMSEIMSRSMQITQKQLEPHLPELRQQIMARVQEQQKQKQQAQPAQPGQAQPAQPGQQGPVQGQTPGQSQPPGPSQSPSQPQPGQQQPQPKPQTPPQ